MAKRARGCPGCAHEEKTAHAAEQRQFRFWLTAVALPFALAALWFLQRTGLADRRLDPGHYRTDIEVVESTVYAAGRDNHASIGPALFRLSHTLGSDRPTSAERHASLAIGRLAADADLEFSMKSLDIVAVRRQWENLRHVHFRQAEWFQRVTAELEAGDAEAATVGIAKDLHRWENTITGLDLALSHVRNALVGWPERDFSSADLQRLEDARTALKNEMEHVRTNQPDVLLQAQPVWSQARRSLETAFSKTEKLLVPSRTASGVPNIHELETRFWLAEHAIRRAREAVAQAVAESSR